MGSDSNSVVVVGAGMGGMAAAIAAAEAGLSVTLIEKSAYVGGACAFSGGQLWVGGNHLQEQMGLGDTPEDTLTYLREDASAKSGLDSMDQGLARRWVYSAIEAARYFEQLGVVKWELIPDFPDYYYPDLAGSRATGRYLTTVFDGKLLGNERRWLLVTPHFPCGVTYGEMAAWGGMARLAHWDKQLLADRSESDFLTFGTAVAAAFYKGVLERGIPVLREHAAEELLVDGDRVVGVRARSTTGTVDLRGQVVLATGSHDWSGDFSKHYVGLSFDDGGSLAPPSVTGDGMKLVSAVNGSISSLPAWAAPVVTGYKVRESIFPGDEGFRNCGEGYLPHSFIVNRRGERFCDDSFHSAIVAATLKGEGGGTDNLPMFMIWDEDHHQRYGLGSVAPGGIYPDYLVESAPTLSELAGKIGVDAAGLEQTAAEYNAHAAKGEDPKFGRGQNLSRRAFRGDGDHDINPNVAPVAKPPFYAMRLRLVNTGITAAGIDTDLHGRVVNQDGNPVDGLYAVGEAAVRRTSGVAYNSGFSLSRAMTFAWLAARHAAGNPVPATN
jgi:3-oxosteroid 1-dehydrogenase